jgi:hypothetical protein
MLLALIAALAFSAFTTLAVAATAGEESFSNVGSSSATLHGQVDPEGVPATYFFEYGQTAAYGADTPVQSAGAASETVNVLATLEGLQPETSYHFRLVVDSAGGAKVEGSDGTFSTFPVGILGLPDGRSYELVSPLGNGDVTVAPRLGGRAAADGSAVVYVATAPPVGGTGQGIGSGFFESGNPYLAERSATGGWHATDIQPAGAQGAGYRSFSNDLSVGFLSSEEPLTAGGPSGRGEGGGPSGLYTREEDGSYALLAENASYAGSTPNDSHILFGGSIALLDKGEGRLEKELKVIVEQRVEEAKILEAEAKKLEEEGEITAAKEKFALAASKLATDELYDSVGGQVRLVSILPDGKPDLNVTVAGSTSGDLEHVISNDGSRIFWTDKTTGDLYVRENDTQPDASTVLVAEEAQFRTASSDGSNVFFTDEKQLTNGSTAAVGAPDLYEYDLQDGVLTDLSVDSNSGEHANVIGVLGASEDGSYVYFVAGGVLAENENAEKERALPHTNPCEPFNTTGGVPITLCNLYVRHQGVTTFIATLTSEDRYAAGEGTIEGDFATSLGSRTAQVTLDGHSVVFTSHASLTGYDNHGTSQIFDYDTVSGSLACVSCNPTGAPATSAPSLPLSSNNTFADRMVSSDGARVFFETTEALVARDTNGRMDVYEWERDGSGSCAREGGCLYLLSGGKSIDGSYLIDASETGDDVFIATRAQLVPQDRGEVFEVYDARVDAPQQPTPSACTGSGCQGVPGAPPIFATPSSVTFNGVGNFPPPSAPVKKVTKKTVKCAKGKRPSHGKCVKAKAKKQHKAKKSTHRKGSK